MGRSKKRQTLRVFLNDKEVGILEKQTTGAMQFSYISSWLESDQATPISYSIPLREEIFRGDEVHHYFENLLPDNQAIRNRIAQKTSAQSSGTFDLLAAIGRDCVGALQFIAESDSYAASKKIQGRRVKESEVATILRNLTMTPLGIGPEDSFRISIAGAHEKTALLKWNGEWFMPEGTTPTTHILKPAIGKLPNGIDMASSVENEWLSLKICERLGLEVVKAEIHQFEELKCLVVERFDRDWTSPQKNLMRLPVEDLCQALGVSSSKKYESHGGPGIVAIEDFLNVSNQRDKDRLEFLKAQIIFYLLAATDGHAKNFSMFLSPRGSWLTPIYDVLSLHPALARRQLKKKDAKLAMAVGKSRHYRMGEISYRHWIETADQSGISKARVESIFASIDTRLKALSSDPIKLPKGFTQEISEQVLIGTEKLKKHLD